MELIVSKTKILGIKGSAIVEINNKIIEEVNEMKDLRLIETYILNWTENAKTRSAKALKALFSVKRKILKLITKRLQQQA